VSGASLQCSEMNDRTLVMKTTASAIKTTLWPPPDDAAVMQVARCEGGAAAAALAPQQMCAYAPHLQADALLRPLSQSYAQPS
jgi:hypothetical protein